jgi:hypothetical protein
MTLGDEPEGTLGPAWDEVGIHGLHRPREWDAVVTVEAPEIDADRVSFAVLPGGRTVVEDGPANVAPLARAVEAVLRPPFHVDAVRRDGGLWATAARTVTIVELPDVIGDEIELAVHDGTRSLLIDGAPAFGSIAALERPDHVARARRLDGDTFEVTFDRL